MQIHELMLATNRRFTHELNLHPAIGGIDRDTVPLRDRQSSLEVAG